MASIGYLTVRVYASTAQLPIEDATVAVTQTTPNGTRQLASRVTDESGRIGSISITTPDLEESLSPGTPSPWTAVDVTVEHPDYERVLIEQLQVFPGIITRQDVELLPLQELPEVYNMTEVIDIPAQSL